jgi:hypothetical protein
MPKRFVLRDLVIVVTPGGTRSIHNARQTLARKLFYGRDCFCRDYLDA